MPDVIHQWHIWEEIAKAVENDECSIGVFIHLKKEFDTIDHNL